MDLRAYFQKIRKLEAEMAEPYVVVVSRETPDGGKPGVLTEVPRALAAKLVAEDQAALASAEAAGQYRAEAERRRMEMAAADEPAAASPRAARVPRAPGKR